ncbi:DUF4249 domain-containing protein [Algoriphagus confluentis]|uniref:DUF4249 domain-containing protein n=1 Tax=Algoriphagus confluentis TaxID=1697556 RepID=A0ABQ6PNG5_9BACT|nr:hypothetical protein Aconfl_14680 [Algoriphagus confluentis]
MFRNWIYLVFFLLFGCIDPFPVDVPEGEQLLTVEGLIHSGPGPHTIVLSRSATYGSDLQSLIRPVVGATVIVRSEDGEVTFLSEREGVRGAYFTPVGWRAQVGKSYTLFIDTPEGKLYSSFPERVESVPEIQSLGIRTVTIPQPGGGPERSGVQIIADIIDPADQNNFYFWRLGAANYILETRPELYTTPAPDRTPAPKDCCAVCYRADIPNNRGVFIAVDDDFNGLSTRIPVGFVEDDGLRFVNKYRVDVKQYSISQNAYRFLRLVKQQAEISGSIFDPPPANIRGNIIALENPDEVVLGYFIAAGEASKRIYVDQADLTFKQNRTVIPDDCRVVPGAALDPPFDWNPNE